LTTLSQTPSSPEIDAAVQALMPAATAVDPQLAAAVNPSPSWYTTWWGITLIGVAAAAATTTTVLLLSDGDTEYRFEP
ncbi:MAG: hypothetical protein AAFN74_15275, partial [Myxococcota bacterium]